MLPAYPNMKTQYKHYQYTIHAPNSATSCSVSATVFHQLAATANTTTATGLSGSPNPVLAPSYLPAAWLTLTKLYNSFPMFVGGTQCLYIHRAAVNTIGTRRLSTYCRIQLYTNLKKYIRISVAINVTFLTYSNLQQCSPQALPVPCFHPSHPSVTNS